MIKAGEMTSPGQSMIVAAPYPVVPEQLAAAQAMLAAAAAAVGGSPPPSKKELLTLRLTAAEISSDSAGLEIRTAGGKGYASRTPVSRRYREAAFIPVQSPSEAQLRWELDRCE